MCFLIVVGTASPRSRCWQGWFPRRPLSLACGRSPSCCLFTHCSSVRADPGASLWVLVSSLDASQIGLGSILRSSFYLSYFFFLLFFNWWKITLQCCFNYFFKGLISKYSHILRYLELGLQHRNLEGAQFIP